MENDWESSSLGDTTAPWRGGGGRGREGEGGGEGRGEGGREGKRDGEREEERRGEGRGEEIERENNDLTTHKAICP